MNKYQEALKTMCGKCINHEMCQGTGCNPKNILKELVGKTTPMKPFKRKELMVDYIIGTCPACGCGVDNNLIKLDDDKITFCENCGQPIDWSDEE